MRAAANLSMSGLRPPTHLLVSARRYRQPRFIGVHRPAMTRLADHPQEGFSEKALHPISPPRIRAPYGWVVPPCKSQALFSPCRVTSFDSKTRQQASFSSQFEFERLIPRGKLWNCRSPNLANMSRCCELLLHIAGWAPKVLLRHILIVPSVECLGRIDRGDRRSRRDPHPHFHIAGVGEGSIVSAN